MKKKNLKLLAEAENLIHQELEIRYVSLEDELIYSNDYTEEEIDTILEYIGFIMSDIQSDLYSQINMSIEKLMKNHKKKG